jgi:predicted acylesterase/phospholipase RssA
LAEPSPTTGLGGRPRPKCALVFSGGGARGAYEAGVIHYLLDELPKRLGHPISFDILCGTSVGAIHACFLAATAELGYHDARSREYEFAAFFSDKPFEPDL